MSDSIRAGFPQSRNAWGNERRNPVARERPGDYSEKPRGIHPLPEGVFAADARTRRRANGDFAAASLEANSRSELGRFSQDCNSTYKLSKDKVF